MNKNLWIQLILENFRIIKNEKVFETSNGVKILEGCKVATSITVKIRDFDTLSINR